jgi:phosphatidyl-myo-inositol dimannoside synthase
VRFLGRLPTTTSRRSTACADVFAMLCRDRWLGLEQEGFGIVFVEAAAAGPPGRRPQRRAARGRGRRRTGLVVDRTRDVGAVADSSIACSARKRSCRELGVAARHRATTELTYDLLADRLATALDAVDLRTPRPGDRR